MRSGILSGNIDVRQVVFANRLSCDFILACRDAGLVCARRTCSGPGGHGFMTVPRPAIQSMHIRKDVIDAIGHTPLIKLKAASKATGCEILGKAELANPGR